MSKKSIRKIPPKISLKPTEKIDILGQALSQISQKISEIKKAEIDKVSSLSQSQELKIDLPEEEITEKKIDVALEDWFDEEISTNKAKELMDSWNTRIMIKNPTYDFNSLIQQFVLIANELKDNPGQISPAEHICKSLLMEKTERALEEINNLDETISSMMNYLMQINDQDTYLALFIIYCLDLTIEETIEASEPSLKINIIFKENKLECKNISRKINKIKTSKYEGQLLEGVPQ